MAARSHSRRVSAADSVADPITQNPPLAPPPKAIAPNAATRVNLTRVAAPVKREPVPEHVRHEMIKQAAYLRAEQRGFIPGFDTEDWLAAEAEVDSVLRERYF